MINESKIGNKENNFLYDFDIFIINRYPPKSSIYRVAEDLYYSLNYSPIWINLQLNSEGWEYKHSGMDFKGKFNKQLLNRIFLNYSFEDAYKFINNYNKNKRGKIIFYTNQFSGILKANALLRIIYVIDSPYYNEFGYLNKIYMDHLYNSLKKEKYIITNTESLKKDLIKFGFTGNITTIHLSYDPSKFFKMDIDKNEIRKGLNLPLDKKLILSVSSNLPRKNLIMVEKTIKNLNNEYRLVRVGEPLENSITFKNVEDSTLNMLYNACDLLLFPSIYEGFGLPVIEAFATGLPVVTSDIPTIREISGDAAILVDPNDLKSILEGVKNAINNGEKLIEKGMERSKNFTRDKFKEKIIDYYKNVIKSL